MPTNGNAGAAWAAYAARAGLHDAGRRCRSARRRSPGPSASSTGADLRLVDGLISDAGRLVRVGARPTSPDDWFDVATLKEPYRIEGKKTMGFEIAEQLGWRMPDVIVYPTGGGVGLIGIYKALHRAGRARLGHRAAAAAGLRPVDRVRADRAGLRGRRARVRAVGGRDDGRVRHQRAQGARRLPGARGAARHGRHGGRGGRRRPAGGPARWPGGWRGCSSAPRARRP